jgi:putative ABC transport system permease protein
VRDSKFQSLDEKPAPAVYLPVMQNYSSEANFLVRVAGNPAGMARAVESAIHAVDPALPVFGARPLEASTATAYFGQRMGGSLLGVFGALALTLAAIGLYGVLAYNVTQRAREVGIRVALGAARGDVLRLILGHGLRMAGLGIAIGLTIAAGVTRLMTRMLFDVSPLDAPVIAGVAVLLGVVAVAASLLPAWRATRIDPIVAIRCQ